MLRTKIAVFVSGGGTNLQALIDAEKRGEIPSGELALVLASNDSAYALQRAAANGIPSAVVKRKDYETQEAYEDALKAVLAAHGIGMIVLAGFMSILSAYFTGAYPERIINIHPSLIPAFCGKGFYGLRVHEAALAAGVKVTGATVHYVNEIPDGGEILLQKAVDILEGDTPETLQRRVMEQAEWILLPKATEQVAARLQQKGTCSMNVYQQEAMAERIRGNSYVGRGIAIGKTADGSKAAIAYFIMGRSENSRNRIFREEGEDVMIYPYDPSKVEDPSLIIYAPIRKLDGKLIVTNGDQTDTIRDFVLAGKGFEEALETREFEPDAPNWTPRISGMLTFADGDFTYKMSILKSADAAGTACSRYTFSYPALAGCGHFIHTYMGDGSPLPTFCGEPERITVPDDIDAWTKEIWDGLDAENKISLYVRFVDLQSGAAESRMVNKYQSVAE